MASKYAKAEKLAAALNAAGFHASTTRHAPIYHRHPASVWVWGRFTCIQVQQMERIAKSLDSTARVIPPIGAEADILISAYELPTCPEDRHDEQLELT